ncbi:MAG: hypothetical protein Q3Y08_03590, partial [Butyricicoccus sp.]|nr:hypothetical protein [Butyricicoccus sp.]
VYISYEARKKKQRWGIYHSYGAALIQNHILSALGDMKLEEFSPNMIAALYSRFHSQQNMTPQIWHQSTNCCTAHLSRQCFGSMQTEIPFT